LGGNLCRLGIREKNIQAIQRRANVSTTSSYYIKPTADDVKNAMETLEQHILSADEAPQNASGH